MPAKTYDPPVKTLVETEPESWPAFLGRPTGPTTVVDSDIATVSGAADKVLRVAAQPPYLLHLEFVSGHDAVVLPPKLLVRNGLLADRHDLRVRSAVVLLHSGADSPQLTGRYERSFPEEEPYLIFRYQVVRVWQLPLKPLLTGGLALLPLAPICAVTEAELPGIIQQMEQRLRSRRARKQARELWAATGLLMGLRYPPELVVQLLQGVFSMKESSTYQAILEEGLAKGRVEGRTEGRTEGAVVEAKKFLRMLGDDAFGPPDARIVAALERLDLPQLEELGKRIMKAKSWQELLGQRPPERRRGRRQTP